MTTHEDDVYKRIMDNAKDPDYNGSTYVNPDWYKSERQRAEEARQELEDWNKFCEEQKSKETEIERYCNKIRGYIPFYYKTFEEYKKDNEENLKYRYKLAEEYREIRGFLRKKPEGMTVKEWKEKKRLIRLERKQQDTDQKLEDKITPHWQLSDNIGVCLHACDCTGEGLRNGIVCDTCKLLVKVNNYMLNLFKDAAEGRSIIV